MKSLAIILGTIAFAISGALADDSASAIDTQALLKQLNALKTQSTTQTNHSLTPIIQQVKTAAANDLTAVALYEQSEKINHFDGKNSGAGDFAKWKKKQDLEFQNSTTRLALRMQLAYLALALEKAAGDSPKTLAPAIWDYIKQLSANSDRIDFDFLGGGNRGGQVGSIADSEVARALQCAPYLRNLKDWELNPVDGYAIFKNSLIPLLRAEKDPQISRYWDAMIDLTAQSVAKSNQPIRSTAFETVQKPQMLWDRAQDIVAIGNRSAGIAEMVKIIKSNTLHPNVSTWISTLEALLKDNTSATASASPAATSTSSPAPAPLTTNAPANPQPAAATTPTPLPAATPENYPPDVSILPDSSPTPTSATSGSSPAANH